ncbi:MAG: hypothetical protein ABI725_06775 [Chloroflexota bacterium]
MSANEHALEIRLADGRIVVAMPRPEDQPYLSQIGSDATIKLGTSDADTSGHGISDQIEVDVSGHAMTLRLPTPADAEALRRLLMVTAMSATIVAAGAVASLQPHAIPSAQTIIDRGPAPVPAQDFAQRREIQIDEMLGAPPAVAPADNLTIDRGVHGAPPAAGSVSSSQVAPAPAVRPGTPSSQFAEQREQAADDMLAAPGGAAPVTPADGPTHGGPQE